LEISYSLGYVHFECILISIIYEVYLLFSDEDHHEEHSYNVTCNDDCFSQMFDKLASDKLSSQEREKHCDSLHGIARSLMYSRLCRNILSDLPEHRAVADKGGTSYRELLCTSDCTGWIWK